MARTQFTSTLTVTTATGSQYTQTMSDNDVLSRLIANNVSSLQLQTQDDTGATVTITFTQAESVHPGWTPV